MYLGNACPWCHRVMLALVLRGLLPHIGVTHAVDDAERASRGGWVFDAPEPVFGARDLRCASHLEGFISVRIAVVAVVLPVWSMSMRGCWSVCRWSSVSHLGLPVARIDAGRAVLCYECIRSHIQALF